MSKVHVDMLVTQLREKMQEYFDLKEIGFNIRSSEQVNKVGFMFVSFFGDTSNAIHIPEITTKTEFDSIWARVIWRLHQDLVACCQNRPAMQQNYNISTYTSNIFAEATRPPNAYFFQLTDGPISKIFDMDIQYSNSKTYAIFTCTDKVTKEVFKFYAKYYKDQNAWSLADKQHSIFRRMEAPAEMSISYNITSCDMPKIDYATGLVSLPYKQSLQRNPVSIVWWDIKEHTPNVLSVDFVKIILTNNATHKNGVLVNSFNFRFSTTKTGKLQVRKEALDVPEWVHTIRSEQDFIANPLNAPAHPFLDPKNLPKFEGANLFITSNDNVYIKMADEHWILTFGADWLSKHLNVLPEKIQKEWRQSSLVEQLMK